MIQTRRGLCACLTALAGIIALSGCAATHGEPVATASQKLDTPPRQDTTPNPESPAITEVLLGPSPPEPQSDRDPHAAYEIGAADELDISVYGEPDLVTKQAVRPDGKIAFPLIGDVQASGRTPDELRRKITQDLARFVRNPRVTVIVSAYKSKKVSVLGEVRYPGVVPLSPDITLLEGVSRAGGVTENADLEGAMLVRNGRVLRVSFEKLLRAGDIEHNNVALESADVILIPNVAAKKVFVLGEVRQPLVTSLKYALNLVEIIAMAGGFTKDAEKKNVLVIRGGLGDPKILTVNVEAITRRGRIDQNIALRNGDIVYAPPSLIADVDRFFQHLTTWLQPIVMAESGVVLGLGTTAVTVSP